MHPRSNADFNPGDDDVGQRLREEEAERDDSPARKTRDLEESVRGNKGLSQTRQDRGSEGSETEDALKRSTDRRNRR